MDKNIINRVQKSGIVTIDLDDVNIPRKYITYRNGSS